MSEQPIGSTLDALGVVHNPEDGELIASALVLMRVISPEGEEHVAFARSENMSWVEVVGMLTVAKRMELDRLSEEDDGDES